VRNNRWVSITGMCPLLSSKQINMFFQTAKLYVNIISHLEPSNFAGRREESQNKSLYHQDSIRKALTNIMFNLTLSVKYFLSL